ncbi:MAG: histidinol-phosphate transaminase [Gammaproteobacteria bacterium]
MSVLNLARPELLGRKGYTAALGRFDMTRLHANEAPGFEDIEDDELNRYPPPRPIAVNQRLSELLGISPEHLLVTRGSNEGIDLLVRAFCRGGIDSIVTCPPTFGMYEVCAEVQGAAVIKVPLDDEFDLDCDAVVDAVNNSQGSAKLVFVCSPANPTGSHLDVDRLESLCQSLKDKAVVVLDQAYIEFSDKPDSFDSDIGFDNLVVLRTFSKAYGLAGLRCGLVIAKPQVIALLDSLLAPYSTPTPTIKGVLDALSDTNLVRSRKRIEDVANEKKKLIAFLDQSDLISKRFPSDSNFVLVQSPRAQELYDHVYSRNILIRSFIRTERLENCLRITVGSQTENNRLMAAFEELSNVQ